MGRKLKKGAKGPSAQYLTRSHAIRRLQLTLADFRRLCILKGVYPREPNKKSKGTDKTYFHVKDLKILEHDTLLDKFREIKSHLKRYKKYTGRKQFKKAEEHLEEKPRYTLGHVIRERYPSFPDALRDLDDALCLVSLFANFPQHQSLEIQNKDILLCQRLYSEWMTYCAITQCFTKAFFSIKGTYYQVEIMGQKITWIAPYQFNQRLPFEIDYKVIGTFREFYVALLRFVNFKLFKDLGLAYPPKDVKGISTDFLDEGNQIYLRTDQVRQLQAIAQKKFQEEYEDSVEKIGVSDEFKNTPEMAALTKKNEEMKRQRRLFSKCTFLLNREVPVYGLQYLILSFGGAFYSQDDFENIAEPEEKPKITHHVLDRPLSQTQIQKAKSTNIELIQPQYILDCLNNLHLLPMAPYQPGTPAPPHLSPFVDGRAEGYLPQREKEILNLKGEEIIEDEEEESSEELDQGNDDMSDEDDEESKPAAGAKGNQDSATQDAPKDAEKNKGDLDSSSEEDNDEEKIMRGDMTSHEAAALKEKKKKQNEKLKRDIAKEQIELGRSLMTNRQRKLYQKVESEKKVKEEEIKKLKVKRKIIEKKTKAK